MKYIFRNNIVFLTSKYIEIHKFRKMAKQPIQRMSSINDTLFKGLRPIKSTKEHPLNGLQTELSWKLENSNAVIVSFNSYCNAKKTSKYKKFPRISLNFRYHSYQTQSDHWLCLSLTHSLTN